MCFYKKFYWFYIFFFFIAINANVAFCGNLPLGLINGSPVLPEDLSLKNHVRLFKRFQAFENQREQLFNEFLSNRLLSMEAKKYGLNINEYLRVHVFSKIPAITNEQVDEYIQKNKKLYRDFMHNQKQLQNKIRQGLLEEMKDKKVDELLSKLKRDVDIEYKSITFSKPKYAVHVNDNDHFIGNDKTSVLIVVFFDFGCGYCRMLFRTLIEVKNHFGNKVKLVFKQFPLNLSNPAMYRAISAECAGKQNRFIDYSNLLFNSQSRQLPSNNVMSDYAEQLNLDMDAFHACMDQNDSTHIGENIREGQKLKIESVPTIFINGFPLIGNVNQEEIESLIQSELDSAQKSK
ncbi:DSBA oxidoreductase [Candidatus Magnetomorum sp. HK-1]|nr:DSBA oxidoreductase [Candidatus Magnetomorum sp. HK-1]